MFDGQISYIHDVSTPMVLINTISVNFTSNRRLSPVLCPHRNFDVARCEGCGKVPDSWMCFFLKHDSNYDLTHEFPVQERTLYTYVYIIANMYIYIYMYM